MGDGVKILAFSPMELPWVQGARYSGLERLAVEHAAEWAMLGHDVTLLAHSETTVPHNVRFIPCEGYVNGDRTIHAELKAFQKHQSLFRDYDVIWDIGHLHLIARMMKLPVVSVFSANPQYEAQAKNEKAPYNLISWSKWGIGQIRKYYQRGAVYQETIVVDPDVYKPKGKRGDRYLTIGRMHPEKGNLNAIRLCKQLGLKLDVVGGRGSEAGDNDATTEYEKALMEACDDDRVFYGEVSDEQKIELMQSCAGLLYITGHVEITSHKVQEALLCGAPVVIPNAGGLPEIITHGVDGFVCSNPDEYLMAVAQMDKLDPSKTRDEVVEKYRPENVAEAYIKLFEEVADGRRW